MRGDVDATRLRLADQASALRALADRTSLPDVAEAFGIREEGLEAWARGHGWPAPDVLRRHAATLDNLTKRQPGRARPGRTRPDLSVAHTPPPQPRPQENPVTAPTPTTPQSLHPSTAPRLADLVAAARTPAAKRLAVRAEQASDKAREAVANLRKQVILDEQADEAMAEVRRLEEQLKEARARARGVAPIAAGGRTPSGSPATESTAVRAWAAENGVDCPSRGVVPDRVRDAYLAAQAAS